MTQPMENLLTYSIASSPSPVVVSPSVTEPSMATLTFAISCPYATGSVSVAQISIKLPVQSQNPKDPLDATALAATPPAQSAATISSSGPESWNVEAGAAAGVFIFKPSNGPAKVSTQSLTITFTGVAISLAVGTALIEIKEWAAKGNGTPPAPGTAAPSGAGTAAVAKFPYGFYASNLAADHAGVASGRTVTLTWNASTNATCKLSFSDQDPIDVSKVRSWTSPQLYETTVFMLQASATQGNQTVTLDLVTIVEVVTPAVTDFKAVPSRIDAGQKVQLTWHAINADGVYLNIGQSSQQQLPAVSDDANPKKIVLEFGTDYSLQAFKGQGDAQVLSAPYDLIFSFFSPVITLSADPARVDASHPTTKLSWDVAHATAVTYQGKTVGAKGAQPESPLVDTTYKVAATGADGKVTTQTTTVTAAPMVQWHGADMQLKWDGGTIVLILTFRVDNATAGSITSMSLYLRVKAGFTNESATMALGGIVLGQVTPGTWRGMTQLSVPSGLFMLKTSVHARATLAYRFDGFHPLQSMVEVDGEIM